MRGSAAFRAAVAPGGVLAGPWVRNELWRRARAVPSLDLRFAENKSLGDAVTGQSLVTFTRASSGTYVGSDGLIKTATTDVPRFDHDPTTGVSLGLLVEEQRTNLLLRSEEFGDAAWAQVFLNEQITANTATAPDGTQTADAIATVSGTTAEFGVGQNATITSGAACTYSVFAKSSASNFIYLRYYGGTNNFFYTAIIDLSSGTVTKSATGSSTTNASASVVAAGNGWYKISLTATHLGRTSVICIVGPAPSSTATIGSTFGEVNFTGSANQSVLIWGAQLEVGSFPTSYIPTTTATVTRSADVASITTLGANIRSLFMQFRSPASGTRPVVSLDDNSANERIEILTSGTDPKLLVTDGGSAVADLDGGTVTANVAARIAARFNTDDYAISINGGASQLDSSGTLPAVDRIRIGSNQAGGYFNGTIARIAGWDAGLPSLPPITQ